LSVSSLIDCIGIDFRTLSFRSMHNAFSYRLWFEYSRFAKVRGLIIWRCGSP